MNTKFKSGDWVRVSDDHPSPERRGKTGVILEYNDDLCGDGCCHGYSLSDEPMVFYWPSELTLLEVVNE